MMEERKNVSLIIDEMICRYGDYSRGEERSRITVEKYLRDVRKFQEYLCLLGGDGLGGKEADKCGSGRKVVLEHKQYLNEHHKTISANFMLAAANNFLEYLGCGEYKVKLFRIQHVQLSGPERELTEKDYRRLIQAAERKRDAWMSMLFQTIRSTGIRISELRLIMVKSLGHGRADIYNRGKSRITLPPAELVRMLTKYCRRIGITGGSTFITRNRKSTDRNNINKKMKEMSQEAGVGEREVFPHNFCYLFARIFYRIEKDVVRLMDLLGHFSINTTRVYTMNTEEQPRGQMSRMQLVLD